MMKLSRQSVGVAVGYLLALAAAREALADETMTPIAMGGNWMAFSHHPTMLAPPDTCLAASSSEQTHIILRVDANDVEFRLANDEWSLPTGVTGTIRVTVGGWSDTLDVAYNTDNRVDAVISRADLTNMVAAMDKSPTMMIAIGHSPSTVVSLAGSTVVTNAFLTCSGIKGAVAPTGKTPSE